jgi:hypothetical protein
MKYLVQILLPLNDNRGKHLEPELFSVTRDELTDRFGGVTAHMQAPARGLWKTDEGQISRDDIVIMEVMVAAIDAEWWSGYKKKLLRRFAQDELMIRAMQTSTL